MGPFIGISATICRVRELVALYAPLSSPVTVVGPTGVGKGVIARRLHEGGARDGNMVTLVGGQLSESLFHSQLFGHLRGAFTGAHERSKGAFQLAERGTLFLDELSHWSPAVQRAILRPLAEGYYRPIGAEREIPIACRVVIGSNRPLAELVASGLLMPDLRWRAGLFEIEIPGLKDRPSDILPLAHHFIQNITVFPNEECGLSLGPSAVHALIGHSWPGNVRELEQVITYGLVHAKAAGSAALEVHHLPSYLHGAYRSLTDLDGPSFGETMEWALLRSDGRRGKAADLLAVHRNTIGRWARSGSKSQIGCAKA